MKTFKILTALLFAMALPRVFAVDYNIKYSSNYLMPAYVHFQENGKTYSVNASINVPLYKIKFSANGTQSSNQFSMLNYQDSRNGKPYAKANIQGKQIEYGKIKDGLKTESINVPIFDLFSMAFQLSYYDQLPLNFQTTNGKKLYPANNVVLNKSEKNVKTDNGETKEITYKFKMEDKDFMVKKYQNEKFPRYISYSRDGDNYELEFDSFVK